MRTVLWVVRKCFFTCRLILDRTTDRWWWRKRNSVSTYLLPIAPVFCHHFPQCLQYFDAQTLLILFQQLLCVFNQSDQEKRRRVKEKKGEHIKLDWWNQQSSNYLTPTLSKMILILKWLAFETKTIDLDKQHSLVLHILNITRTCVFELPDTNTEPRDSLELVRVNTLFSNLLYSTMAAISSRIIPATTTTAPCVPPGSL